MCVCAALDVLHEHIGSAVTNAECDMEKGRAAGITFRWAPP
jgi:hypothetical protein